MSKIIKSMSAEQWAQCFEMRQSIYDMCASPTNKDLATQAVNALYKNAFEKLPKIVFCKSPLQGLVLLYGLKAKVNLRDSLESNLRNNIEGNIRDSLGDNLEGRLWKSLRGSLEDLEEDLIDNLWENLTESLLRSFWENIKDNIKGTLGNNLWDSLENSLGENLGEAPWRSLEHNVWNFYWRKGDLGFFLGAEIAGIRYNPDKWEDYKLIVSNLDVIIPFEELCIVCERPVKIDWHDAGGIHCEDGPAVEYADGYKLWAIEGHLVPKSVVMEPHLQTIADIHNEQNEEIRRIRINRFGWNRYIQEVGASVLDVATPKYGGMESLMRTSQGTVLCTYDPSTGRPYSLEVDPSCQTCEQAQRYLLAPDVAFRRHGVNVKNIETYPLIRA